MLCLANGSVDLKSFTQAIQQIADEKGISRQKILETIEMALASAYKRDYGKRGQIIRATLDPATGSVIFTQVKIVVDESMVRPEDEEEEGEEERERAASQNERRTGPLTADDLDDGREERLAASEEKKIRFNPERHLMPEEARKIKEDVVPGDELTFPLPAQRDYGRIAAQTAKQVIIQRIREAEREAVYDEYKGKEGELVSGIVQRVEGGNVFVDIGRTVGILPPDEQMPSERYRIGQRIKTLVMIVERSQKGSGVLLSRTHPRMLRKLFELEVPEIAAETVEIKAVAREPGSRSKVAVVSHEPGVDPVGSLVGQKGVRVSTVIQELSGEKIDVIAWVEDPGRFIANALSPAKVIDVVIQEKRKEAQAIVPEDQLSLAIGKAGQNVRLAAKLTGWRIDVRAEGTPAVEEEERREEDMEAVESSDEGSTDMEDTRAIVENADTAVDTADEETASPKE